MGMSSSDDYISYKVIKDKMVALASNGLLASWNISTAKLLTRKVFDEY